MNTLIDFIKIILLTGLIIYVYFALIKKLSNNYKVLILPFITLINSIIFGYKANSNDDDITLIIWLVIFLTSLLLIVLVIRKINSKKHKPVQTTINNTEINHNTNIDTIDNSNTFHNLQTNNHFEQNNNVTNIHSKQSSQKKEKVDVMNSSDNTNNKLSEEQLKKLYNFFVDNDLLAENNLELIDFKDLFLKKPIRLKADVPTLREFYNNLKIQKNVTFNKINDDFLIYFINSNDNNIYNYKQFGNHKHTISKLSDEIIELFNKF